jgi:O-antigen ligase
MRYSASGGGIGSEIGHEESAILSAPKAEGRPERRVFLCGASDAVMPSAIRLSGPIVDVDRILRRAEPIFWCTFLFAASGGFAFALGPVRGERLFWIVADLLALTSVTLSLTRYATYIALNFHLFSWPALAALSVLWSLTPGLTFYHALQLFLTLLVGLVMRERFGIAGIMRLLFFALGAAMLLSIALCASGVAGSVGAHGEWQGVYSHKNQLGAFMVVLFFVSLILAVSGWHRGLTLASSAASLAVLLMSQSGSALLVFTVVASAVPFLFALRSGFRPTMLFAGLAMVAVAIVALYLTTSSSTGNPVDLVLNALGKDRTLTGRTTLWEFGLYAFRENPILGLGYKAYWASASTSSAYLRYVVGQDLWFFHNNFLEVAVALGAVGLVVFVIGIIVAVAIAVRRFRDDPTPVNVWALLLMADVLVVSTVENPLFFNHSLLQVLFAVVGTRMERIRYLPP